MLRRKSLVGSTFAIDYGLAGIHVCVDRLCSVDGCPAASASVRCWHSRDSAQLVEDLVTVANDCIM